MRTGSCRQRGGRGSGRRRGRAGSARRGPAATTRRRRPSPRCRCTSPGSAGRPARRARRRPRRCAGAAASWRRRRRRCRAPWRPISATARRALATSTSTTASWNDAATSAVAASGWRSTVRTTGGLEPGEREVVAVVEHRPRERERPPGRRRRRCGRWPGRRGSRGRGSGRPCRRPRRRRRRSSGRAAGSRPGRRISTSRVWPPETSRTTSGQPRSRLLEQRDAKRWPSRWLTPTKGTPQPSASRLGRRSRPTSSAPTRPGPQVAATASTGAAPRSSAASPAAASASATTGGEQLDVGPAGELGDDAAVAGVQVDLAGDDRRADGPAVVDDRGRGLVAGRLDAQDPHQTKTLIGPRAPFTPARPAAPRWRRAARRRRRCRCRGPT